MQDLCEMFSAGFIKALGLYNPPEKKLDMIKISEMLLRGLGAFGRYFWRIVGEHFGTCL